MYSTQEDGTRCAASQPASVVSSEEVVARLLHEGIAPLGVVEAGTFRSEDLQPHDNEDEHLCGASAGVSLFRQPPCDDANLDKRTTDLAGPNRKAFPPAKCLVAKLRGIQVDGLAPGQLVYVLADGSEDNPGHCVLRLKTDLEQHRFKQVRRLILDVFRAGLQQPTS